MNWFYTMPDPLFVLLGMLLIVFPFAGFMARKEIKHWWSVATQPGYQPPSVMDMLYGPGTHLGN